MADDGERLRIDKWLWFARMARSRPLAAALVTAGKVRLNGVRLSAPGKSVKIGDVLTLTLPQGVCVAQVLSLPLRRRPAAEASLCWRDMTSDGDG